MIRVPLMSRIYGIFLQKNITNIIYSIGNVKRQLTNFNMTSIVIFTSTLTSVVKDETSLVGH